MHGRLNAIICSGIIAVLLCTAVVRSGEIVKVVQNDNWDQYLLNIERIPSAIYEPEYQEADLSYETPHTKWAKPYYLGKIKALCIAPQVCHRDTAELAQRMDLECEIFCAFKSDSLGSELTGYSQKEQLTRLNRLLDKKYDVIIVGQMFWKAFSQEVGDKILKKVAEGTGLVISYSNLRAKEFVPPKIGETALAGREQKDMAAGVPFNALSSWKHFPSNAEAIKSIVSFNKLGNGRVALLNVGGSSFNAYFIPPPPLIPELKIWETDYYLSLAAKAVLWAADKYPEDEVKLNLNDKLVAVAGGRSKAVAGLEFQVRDGFGNIVQEGKSGENQFALPDLAAGQYIVDVILRNRDNKCLNWGSASFEIKGACEIRSVEFTPKTIKPDAKINFITTLSGKAGDNMSLQIKLTDMSGRLVGDLNQKVLTGQSDVKTELTLENPLNNLIRIDAVLYEGSRAASRFQTWLPVRMPCPADDFRFVVWDSYANEYSWFYARKELYRLGVDAALATVMGRRDPRIKSWNLALAGLQMIPYMTRYAISEVNNDPLPIRLPCLSDPEYLKEQRQIWKTKTEQSVPFGPAAYTLGDENDLSLNDQEVCFSKSCRAGFREYAKTLYGDINALNQEWDTSFKAWEDIEPIPLEEARKLNQPARWVDFRMHMENVFANIHKIGAATVRETDPEALVGFDGGWDATSFTGYDWWKLSKILDFWCIYPDHLQSELLRSFHKKGALTGRWYGGYRTIGGRFVEHARWDPWYALFHEMNSAYWFNTISTFNSDLHACDALNPVSFRPFSILKATSDEALAIKSGPGRLLLGCCRDSGNIAVLYSQPSLHASTFYAKYGNPANSQYDFIRILEDLSCQYRFISYEQLAQGVLSKEGYRLLILPCSIALSHAEREQITAFANAGGKVLADKTPGIFDEHGKIMEDASWKEKLGKEVDLIGTAISGYMKNKVGAAEKREIIGRKLAALGILPEFSVTADRNELYEGELAVFKDGAATYLGLLRDHSPKIRKQQARLKLPRKAHVYDLRQGAYLGYTDCIEANLEPGMAGLWALLPEKAGDLKLTAPGEAKPGAKVNYSIEVGDANRHVVRINVVDGKGNPRVEYGRNLECKNGKAEAILPLALNDAGGEWMITARDVISGSISKHKLIVK